MFKSIDLKPVFSDQLSTCIKIDLEYNKDMNKFQCKLCGNAHGDKTIYYHLKEKRRMTRDEVNAIGFEGFGSVYAFARYCPIKKEYYIKQGFL